MKKTPKTMTMDKDWGVFLHRLAIRGKKEQEFWHKVGDEFVFLTQQRIRHNKDVNGKPFTPSLRVKAQGGKTLYDTGRLFNSFTYTFIQNGVKVTTDVPYAHALHYGAKIRAKNAEFLRFKTAYGWVSKKEVVLPARPFLGVGEQERASFKELLMEMIYGE